MQSTPLARRLLATVPLLAAVVGVLLVLAAAPASAHAVLVSTSPASGSTIPTPPPGITLTFDEAVRPPAYIVVTGPGGVRADVGAARIQGANVTTALRRTVSAGTYSVAYRVVSDDGHPVEATFTYTIAAETPDDRVEKWVGRGEALHFARHCVGQERSLGR